MAEHGGSGGGGGRPRNRAGTGGGPPKLPRPNISAKPNHLKEKFEKQREELQHEMEETKETENSKQLLEEEFKKWEEGRQQREEARKKKKEGAEAPMERRRAKTISTATPVSAESLSFGLERPKLASSPSPSGPPRPIIKPKKASPSNIDDRVVKDLPWPESKRLTMEEVFDVHGRPKPELIREHFLKEGSSLFFQMVVLLPFSLLRLFFLFIFFCNKGRLEKAAALSLITKAASLFSKEPNMLEVEAPLLS